MKPNITCFNDCMDKDLVIVSSDNMRFVCHQLALVTSFKCGWGSTRGSKGAFIKGVHEVHNEDEGKTIELFLLRAYGNPELKERVDLLDYRGTWDLAALADKFKDEDFIHYLSRGLQNQDLST